jgi:tetratricopeptide (TPR) repeat protein
LLDPGWPQAFFYLGKAYRELSRYQEAAAAMKRAVTLKSDYARAYHYLGLIMIDLGRYEEADALVKAYPIIPAGRKPITTTPLLAFTTSWARIRRSICALSSTSTR